MVIELTTTERVQKKGNSLYILLRREIQEKLDIKPKDLVEIKIKKIENEKKNS